MMRIIKLLMICIVAHDASAASKSSSAMSDLSKSLRNLPSNWKSSTDFCQWSGISCKSGEVTSINLVQKSISGSLPASFNQLSSLQTVNLQRNQISGPLPSLSGLSSLQTLNIDTNQFTSVPPDLFAGLTSLEQVSLDDNPFAPWTIPDDLSKADSLRDFSASNASVSGTLPEFFGQLSSLEDLRLSYNNLSGGLPLSFAGSNIKNLWLNNQKSGEKLTGRIDVLGGMDQLSLVWLQSNSFSGPIPDVSNLTFLTSFNVRDNQLTGVVPDSLTTSKTLLNASLANNNLQGPFPAFKPSVTVDVNKGNNFCLDTPGTCDPRVMTLLAVAAGFGYPQTLATSWKGNDPCAGGWTGVVCDTKGNDILVLNFANQHFVGIISPDISKLTSLTKLLLSNNNLTGPIPDSLVSLKTMQLLDASNNDLWGKVPTFDKSVTLKLGGNPRLGTTPSPGTDGGPYSPPSAGGSSSSSPSGDQPASKSKSSVGVVVGIVIIILALVACIGGSIYYYLKRKQHNEEFKPVVTQSPTNETSENQLKIGIMHSNASSVGARNELFSQGSGDRVLSTIPIEDLRRATNNFSEANILGQGGFGVVYKGNLNGTLIAVKRSESDMTSKKTGLAEFEAEVHVLQKTRHRHLVSFLGYCRDNNEKLLVYEFMPEGTLGQHLFDRDSGKYCPLNWRQRLVIALDMARGIEYLHSLAQESFIHRDLKPSNILLDKDLRAKVSDFGLVKLADKEKSVMTRLAGTFGYLAPEYALTGKVSTKVDVYAFGVILMELITGRKVLDESIDGEDGHLVMAFRRQIINKEKFMHIVDATLELDHKAYESVLQVSELARHCTAREPNQRPTMGYAVQVLSPLVDQWVPTNSNYDQEEDDTDMRLTQELKKWQSDTDSSTFTTYNGSSSTNHF